MKLFSSSFSLGSALVTGLLLLSSPLVGERVEAITGGFFNCQFHGSSSLHDFDGKVSGQLFEAPSAEQPLSLIVKVHNMNTGETARDRNMYKMFSADKYPTIQGQLDPSDLLKVANLESTTLPLKLTICDVQKDFVGTIKNVKQQEHVTTFVCAVNLSLHDFHLECPSAALGLIKVSPQVSVDISFSIEH